MLHRGVAVVIMVGAATSAHAEPEPAFYAELAPSLAGRVASAGDPDKELGVIGFLGLGGGARLRDGAWLRGGIYAGPALGDITRGSAIEGRFGIEHRSDARSSGIYYGVD